MIPKPTPETDPAAFQKAVNSAGLRCLIHSDCWHIKGGANHSLVICWQDLLNRFSFGAFRGPVSQRGTVADAILLAGPPLAIDDKAWNESEENDE